MENQENLSEEAVVEHTPLYARFIGNHMTKVIILFFYSGALTLGLYYHQILEKSPILKYTGKAVGFFASAISWIPSFLIAGVVFGKFNFPKEVFRLYLDQVFCIVMSTIFFSILACIIFRKLTIRFVSPLLFWLVLILSTICISLIIEYLIHSPNRDVYITAFSITGLFYFAALKQG